MNTISYQHGLGKFLDHFTRLYGKAADRCIDRLTTLVGRYGVGYERVASTRWSERDAVLITYGDSIRLPGERPLQTLRRFLERDVEAAFNTVHILPFFPSSSDDGFSVVHYRQVDPLLGTWSDIQEIAKKHRVMTDLVLNHVSRRSNWFRDFEMGVAPARQYFVTADPAADLSAVVRPRSHPLLTPVRTRDGVKHVWTTFSADQVDIDFSNPDVLFEILDILLFYIAMGAKIIRLDAIAYLWKRIGTKCIHLPETHEVVKLMRDLVDLVAPDVLLLTETNVPHAENISYFGAGDEAHMVYQFSLPPLILHAMHTGTAEHLSKWAASLAVTPPGCTFLNFTASHDGIGIRPLEGLVPAGSVDELIEHVRRRNGLVSMKRNADGTESPYELNITWFDAMDGDPARFLCSQTIPLALRGVPAVYLHSMTATPNDNAAVQRTGRARSINRASWDESEVMARLADKTSVTSRVFQSMKRLLSVRAKCAAFHPDAAQEILDLDPRAFVVKRTAADGSTVTAAHNVSGERVELQIAGSRDLITGRTVKTVALEPYECLWLAS